MFAELNHALAGDQVAGVVAFLGAGDNAGVVEESRGVSEVLLGGAERLVELDDGEVAFAQVVERLDPHRLGKDAEASDDQVDERVSGRVRNGRAGGELAEMPR